MTLASAAFGFGQPLWPNLMFRVGVLRFGAGPGPMVDKNLAYTNPEA